jgi:hypothetical protein
MSRKTTLKRRSYRQFIRETVAAGHSFTANGEVLRTNDPHSGTGRGMREQMMAGMRLGQYVRRSK